MFEEDEALFLPELVKMASPVDQKVHLLTHVAAYFVEPSFGDMHT
jgi:hypothetical protein